jgi:hypothetical protein
VHKPPTVLLPNEAIPFAAGKDPALVPSHSTTDIIHLAIGPPTIALLFKPKHLFCHFYVLNEIDQFCLNDARGRTRSKIVSIVISELVFDMVVNCKNNARKFSGTVANWAEPNIYDKSFWDIGRMTF